MKVRGYILKQNIKETIDLAHHILDPLSVLEILCL